jgi:hypothetical protein
MVAVNDRAPGFCLKSDSGEDYRLSDIEALALFRRGAEELLEAIKLLDRDGTD